MGKTQSHGQQCRRPGHEIVQIATGKRSALERYDPLGCCYVADGGVNDAGRWLVSEGIAKPDKLAIVRSSDRPMVLWRLGGLVVQVLDPALFKAVAAAAAIAPVSDLGYRGSHAQAYTNSRRFKDFQHGLDDSTVRASMLADIGQFLDTSMESK